MQTFLIVLFICFVVLTIYAFRLMIRGIKKPVDLTKWNAIRAEKTKPFTFKVNVGNVYKTKFRVKHGRRCVKL